MRSLGKYISKHLASFTLFVLTLLLVNAIIFGMTFSRTFTEDYGQTSPPAMLETVAAASTAAGISEEAAQQLRQNRIWAVYLDAAGHCAWSLDLPDTVPEHYTIQDVALFSKGYIADYPVFVWGTEDGLLVLGYPKDSYMKITRNYLSLDAIKTLPFFVTGILTMDLLLMFLAYYYSKRKIIKNTEPIAAAIETLSDGKPVSLRVQGELSELADSVNKASNILSRQNQARANWISGVSHDIRTPLSIIMGYAGRMISGEGVSVTTREQARIIQQQSKKIKDLVQDLNLVSQLEYEMQPLHKEEIRLSKLLRSYLTELLNAGLEEKYGVDIELLPEAEHFTFECDERLILRAVGNLVQNSIRHNPQGCHILLRLECAAPFCRLTIEDDGVGLSEERMRELKEKPHYLESTDERLNLRHGLGLVLVRQIVAAHGGSMEISSKPNLGYQTTLIFNRCHPADRKKLRKPE